MEQIAIKALRHLDEMYAAVELQQGYWGSDVESIVPAHMLYSLAENGGHVLAAFDNTRLIGVLIGFLGTNIEESHRPAMANLHIASKRMVVLPEYRNQGVGYRLKLAQRDLAIQQGVRLITWTFDPLLSLNAYLNLRKLGAVCQKYRENYYGTESHYASGGASDRLVVDWWVTNRRVEERIKGKRSNLMLQQYLQGNATLVNPTTQTKDHLPLPNNKPNEFTSTLVLLEIPADYLAIVQADESLARAWRTHSREMFQGLLTAGYIVTDFIHELFEGRERAFYVLSYNLAFDFSLN